MKKGWYLESHRHSLARQGIKTGRKSQSENNRAELARIRLNEYLKKKEPNNDYDGDGVKNKKDCVPSDPNRQDLGKYNPFKSKARKIAEQETSFEKEQKQKEIEKEKEEKKREKQIKEHEEAEEELKEKRETYEELKEEKVIDEEEADAIRNELTQEIATLQEEVHNAKKLQEESDEADAPKEFIDPLEEEFLLKKREEKEISLQLDITNTQKRIEQKQKVLNDLGSGGFLSTLFGENRQERLSKAQEELRVANFENKIRRTQLMANKEKEVGTKIGVKKVKEESLFDIF